MTMLPLEAAAESMGGTLVAIAMVGSTPSGTCVWGRGPDGKFAKCVGANAASEGEWVSEDGKTSWRKHPGGTITGIAEVDPAISNAEQVVAIDRSIVGKDGAALHYRVYFGFANQAGEMAGELVPLADRAMTAGAGQ